MRILFSPGFRAEISIARRIRQPRRQIDHYPFGGWLCDALSRIFCFRYTKTVVDVGLDMQKYNPEVKPMTNLQNVDPRVADLVDKLRHVHHMAMSSLGSSGAEVDYMQRDGVEGSGSGNGADFEDNDEEYNTRGSGSGYGPISEGEEDSRNINPIFSKGGKSTMRPPTAPTGEASTVKSSLLVSVVAVALARLY
jgi:hypothetical protein